MPVPVHHAVRAAGQMAVCLHAKLPRIREPFQISLCFGLKDQVVGFFQTSCNAAAEVDLSAGQIVLGRMIDITACDIHAFCRLELVDIRL